MTAAIGNSLGNENPFLLSMGVLWFRVHQYWARQLYSARARIPHELAGDDEWLFNRARQFTIATYQHIVYDEWLPLFLPRKYGAIGVTNYPYNNTPGYSAFVPSPSLLFRLLKNSDKTLSPSSLHLLSPSQFRPSLRAPTLLDVARKHGDHYVEPIFRALLVPVWFRNML